MSPERLEEERRRGTAEEAPRIEELETASTAPWRPTASCSTRRASPPSSPL